MKKIKEVLVVEGRSDTARLRQVLGDVDTIETNGSAINHRTLALIKQAQQLRGVIVITDPDFNGQKIRQKIMAAVPQAKQAFIRRQDGIPAKSHGSLGVEHASAQAIRSALQSVWTPKQAQASSSISQTQLVNLGLLGAANSQQLRTLVGDILHIGYVNAKQLLRRLNMFAISQQQLETAVKQAKEELYGS